MRMASAVNDTSWLFVFVGSAAPRPDCGQNLRGRSREARSLLSCKEQENAHAFVIAEFGGRVDIASL